MKRRFNLDSPLAVFALYVAATLAMTWPLVTRLATDLPADLGDPVLNTWILGWDADHISRFLGGDLGAFSGYWSANIFYPAPLALAYSEHLFAQALQITPIWMLTGNLLLCYNLLFLSTFALSALGAYLLAHEHTASTRAAFIAGLLYGFALYRVPQFSHLQVLSSQWMPFVLLGLGRFARTGRVLPLAGGALALVAQNLSNGYYMLYFAPFVVAYTFWELKRAGRLLDWRRWAALIAAAAVVVAACWPFLSPYLELRRSGYGARRLAEVEQFSADLLAFLTAGWNLTLWGGGRMNVYPHPEGELFPGVVPVVLAVAGLVMGGLNAKRWRAAREAAQVHPRWLPWVIRALLVVAAIYTVLAILIIVGRPLVIDSSVLSLQATRRMRTSGIAIVALTLATLLSPRIRAFWRNLPASSIWFCSGAALVALVLSLGPIVKVAGIRIAAGPYRLLYDYLPGFDGLRVPARMAMIAALFGSVVAAFGVEEIARRWRPSRAIVAGLGILFLLEATPVPVPTNLDPGVVKRAPAPLRIEVGRLAPPVYHYVASLPREAVIVELPVGEDAWEVQYMYYSTLHWRRLLNGYSGGFPEMNLWYRNLLGDPTRAPELAREELAKSGATHAILHRAAYRTTEEFREVEAWLREAGAIQVASFNRDVVFVLPGATKPPGGGPVPAR